MTLIAAGGGRAVLAELSVMEQRYHAVMEVCPERRSARWPAGTGTHPRRARARTGIFHGMSLRCPYALARSVGLGDKALRRLLMAASAVASSPVGRVSTASTWGTAVA